MNDDGLQPRKLFWSTAAVAAPAVLVLTVLWLFGGLAGGLALIAGLTVFAGTAAIVGVLLRDLSSVVNYTERLSGSADARRPALVLGGFFLPLLLAIRRFSRAAEERLRERQNRSSLSRLDHLPDPVLMLDEERRVVADNAAARQLLGSNLVGRDLAAVIRNPAVLDMVDSLSEGDRVIGDVEFSLPAPVELHFSCRAAKVSDTGVDPVEIVIALRDMTALKRAERMRSDFVANASHELRTPISVILGCVQTIQGTARDDPEAQNKFISMMEGQAERVARLVEDLLSLSGIEQKEHTPPTDPLDLGRVIDGVVGDAAFKARQSGIAFDVDLAEGLPEVIGDKDDLYRALQNLVDNAMKYGGEKSKVTVSAKLATENQLGQLPRGSRYVAVSVRDRGEGIGAEHLARLTERFYRVDTARSRELGGTGLGLAIVKHVAGRHRGKLLIESEPGEGSVFTLVLPAWEQAADHAESEESESAAG